MSRGVGRGLNAVDASNSPGLAAIDVSRDNAKHFMVRTREQKKSGNLNVAQNGASSTSDLIKYIISCSSCHDLPLLQLHDAQEVKLSQDNNQRHVPDEVCFV